MTDDRKDARHDTRGSGQRRPGPHQRRLEKQARLNESTHAPRAHSPASGGPGHGHGGHGQGHAQSKPAGTVHRGHGPSGTRGEVHKGRPQAPSVHTIRPTSGDDGEARVVLTQRGLERLQAGHPWIYRSDIDAHPALDGGSVVRLVDPRGWFVGKALYGQRSQIAIRLLSREDEIIDDAFFAARFDRALALRERIRPDPERKRAARLVHGEADFLPGLVVDRYADCVSLQTLTEATDKRKGLFIDLIKAKLSPRAIVERNDPKVRQHEGLEQKKGLLHGALDGPVPYLEGEVTLNADLLEGQKTGAFLDQSENRIEAGRHAYGRALDCFTYGGGFALQLAQHASNVTAVDISEKACADARLAAQRNPEIAAKVFFTCANAFDFLKDQAEAGERYDTIVLDPPAFSKSKDAIDAAVRGYKEINLRAFQMLSAGGVLVTASCSFHVDDVLFERTVLSAAVDAGKSVQIVERRGAGRDHPTLLGMPESRYIKCLVLRVG